MRHRPHKKYVQNPKSSHPNQPFKPAGGTVDGVLDLKGKSGFVLSEQPGLSDVLVQGPSLRLAMNSDRVRVRLTPSRDPNRRTGEIMEVLERARQTVVGEFRRFKNEPVLVLESDAGFIGLKNLGKHNPAEGDMIVALITQWPTQNQPAAGDLIETLGPRNGAGVELKALVHKYELPSEFPSDVDGEADSFGTVVEPSMWEGRETYFHKNVVTIDGADAKDFDDAISIERRPNGGWQLGVHIADVANYVRSGSALDKEAVRRSTSVYLTGHVIPMLPFALSANLCSLRPNEERLTLSCVMDLDAEGDMESYRVFESVIRSAKRFTYDEVDGILKGARPETLPQSIINDVLEMDLLAKLLRKKRFARGSLDFDFPEPYVVLDHRGRPIDIKKRERLESHRLIEDFMLLANETVATFMKEFPFLYRVHDKPDPARLEKLRKTLESAGVPIPAGFNSGSPMALQRIISWSEGKPMKAMVQTMTLRSLKQAIYSPLNLGHFGLASPCYTHFTSPIRRYPDLVVHRLVKERLHKKLDKHRQSQWAGELPPITAHASRRERVAVDAEREFLDIQKVRLMEEHVGKEFDGVITGITNFGIFIQLESFFVEGLVHIANLGDDYYFFDEVRMLLRGRRTNRVFTMGQSVRIRVASANVVKRQLDFELIKASDNASPRSFNDRRSHERVASKTGAPSSNDGKREPFYKHFQKKKKHRHKKHKHP